MEETRRGAAPEGRAQGGVLPYTGAVPEGSDPTLGVQEVGWPAVRESFGGGAHSVTAAEVEEIVRRVLAGTKLYVLEADITEAQNAVKGVVEQTFF